MEVSCISIRNPLSYLVCAGIKDVENRTWKTEHRGRLFIHSSGPCDYQGIISLDDLPVKTYNEYHSLCVAADEGRLESCLAALPRWRLGSDGSLELVDFENEESRRQIELISYIRKRNRSAMATFLSGAVIGHVDLVDIVEDYDSAWRTEERYAWILRNPVLFDQPYTGIKGQLRIFKQDLPDPDTRRPAF